VLKMEVLKHSRRHKYLIIYTPKEEERANEWAKFLISQTPDYTVELIKEYDDRDIYITAYLFVKKGFIPI